jgi:hypothetical protein
VVRAKRYALCRRTVGVRTVWVLGAGASKAAYCGMPLVKDFMEEALHRLRFSGNQGIRLLDFIRDTYGYEHPTDVNIEELLTFASCDASHLDAQDSIVLQDREKARRLVGAQDTLRKVESVIVMVLFQAQRECMQRGDWVHDSLAERVGIQDAVISYNYDLLFDYALWKARKASSDHYGIPFIGAHDGTPGLSHLEEYVREPSIQPDPPEGAEGVQVLKLHGSLNWLGFEHVDPFQPGPEVFYLRNATGISFGSDLWWRGFGPVRNDGTGETRCLRPIIVPPTFAKDLWKGSLMGTLWSKALTALQECKRVVVIGLSLRDADYQTRWLLRTSLTIGRPRDVEIDIVNPSSEDRDRLRRFFLDLGRVVLYETVDKFLAGRTV